METKVVVRPGAEDTLEVFAEHSGVTLIIDKKRDGHIPRGPNPLELFLASLAGCVGLYARNYLQRRSIAFSQLEIESDAELSEESPRRLINIQLKIATDAELGNKTGFLKFVKSCPIHNTILDTLHIHIGID